ncbi:MAG: (d)CMP kinase [candidate division WOR-3 bacterium]|nr:(d)CMP kinase [candidate division WOR-3 bacterium]
MTKGLVVAIDGTAGSGKSTTAKKAAEALGFFYLDTGAMYRAITWKIINAKIDLCDTNSIKKLVAQTKIDITKDNRIMLDNKDMAEEIRKPEIDKLVSQVSVLPIVRQKMVSEQHRIAKGRNVICEGRDIGSVVFPNANLKIYLDCDLEERTTRREKELKEKGIKVTRKAIKENFLERDYIDSTREHSPLRKTDDAVFLDTTNLTIEEEVKIVTDMISDRLLNKIDANPTAENLTTAEERL